ncbi:MAG: hypothetical protein AABY22_10875 [Nanoarchaeota archaeon]
MKSKPENIRTCEACGLLFDIIIADGHRFYDNFLQKHVGEIVCPFCKHRVYDK